jgi:hypothetical protein
MRTHLDSLPRNAFHAEAAQGNITTTLDERFWKRPVPVLSSHHVVHTTITITITTIVTTIIAITATTEQLGKSRR